MPRYNTQLLLAIRSLSEICGQRANVASGIRQYMLSSLYVRWYNPSGCFTCSRIHKQWINQPWRCLCFGFSQIILIEPFLLMTLHFSQIGFTDDLTFTGNPPSVKYSIKICSLGRSYTHVQARPHCIVALWSTKCKQFFKFFLHFSNFFSFWKFETFFSMFICFYNNRRNSCTMGAFPQAQEFYIH